jgi:hypothetical protein
MDEVHALQIGTPVLILPIGIYSAIERVHVVQRTDKSFFITYDCECVEYSQGWIAADLEVAEDHSAGATVQ